MGVEDEREVRRQRHPRNGRSRAAARGGHPGGRGPLLTVAWGAKARALSGAATLCGCHYRDTKRAEGDADPSKYEGHAKALCGAWACGVPLTRRSPSHDAVAAHVARALGLSRVPDGCPLAPLYQHAPPIVHRALAGRARLDKGHGLRGAYPGGETAVDVLASDIVTRGINARDRSDDAIREKERKTKEAADLAAQKGKR